MGLSPAAILYDPSGNPVSIISDGGVYRLSGVTKVLSAAGAQVNPATEDTLSTRASEATLATRATESTLSSVDSWLGLVDTTLDSIKDTDGIKKITDPVAAKVGQGPTYLESLSVSGDVSRLKATLYSQDGDAVAFGSVAPNPENIKNDFLKNGGSPNLLVNGSTTPVEFTYNADPTYDISIMEIGFVIASNSLTYGTGYFGAVAGPLTNGLLVEITSDGNTGVVANLTQNECFVHFSSPGGFDWIVSSKDMVYSTYVVGGGLKLHAGTGDNIKVTVRDNLSAAGVYFQCMVKGNLLG